MRIEGYIFQIFKPNDHDWGSIWDDAKGKYILLITNVANVPNGPLVFHLGYYLKHRKELRSWTVLTENSLLREGDKISVEVEAFSPFVEVWTEQKKAGL